MSHMPASSGGLCLSDNPVDHIRVHRLARHLPELPAGPFVRTSDGKLLSVAGNPTVVRISSDAGRTWEEQAPSPVNRASHTGALLDTSAGTIILAFADLGRRHWTWQDALRDAPGARLPTCVARSVDRGRTWQDDQTLHEAWTGATRDIIQLADRRIIFTSMKMRHDPGRHTVLTYFSDDDGVTWAASNVIDLGGNGHHGGMTEGTIVELRSGRLLQYIRTNWGQLWRAESTDRGETWHPYGPAGIPASSAPALLKRLRSGRILLLWNRPDPEGEDGYPLVGGDGIWSATPVSNFRAELSMSFSEDECATWSPPVTIARSDDPTRRPEVSYPYAFEPTAGTLWITAHRWDLRMSLQEADFVTAV